MRSVDDTNSIFITTNSVEMERIEKYLGVVSGETVIGLNFYKDWIAGWKDRLGGRVRGYEEEIRKGQKDSILKMVERAQSLGADAITGMRINIDVFSPRGRGTVVGVFVYGTAVKLKPYKKSFLSCC